VAETCLEVCLDVNFTASSPIFSSARVCYIAFSLRLFSGFFFWESPTPPRLFSS